EILRATAAMNNLGELTGDAIEMINKIFGGDTAQFACAAEHITGRCVRQNVDHHCEATNTRHIPPAPTEAQVKTQTAQASAAAASAAAAHSAATQALAAAQTAATQAAAKAAMDAAKAAADAAEKAKSDAETAAAHLELLKYLAGLNT